MALGVNMVYELLQTATFKRWFESLKDKRAQQQIWKRLRRIEKTNNFGDWKPLKGDLYELRITTGKGYRVYYTIQDKQLVILLAGSDKSDQVKMIKRAREILEDEYS